MPFSDEHTHAQHPHSVLSLMAFNEHLSLSHTNFCRPLHLYGVFTGV